MSTTYHAAAIVGCKVPKSEILHTEEVQSCEHTITEEMCQRNSPFCPECGKKLWRQETTAIPQYNPDEKTLCGFRVFDNEQDDFVIVASEVAETDVYSEPEMISAYRADGMMRQSLMVALKPHGLWNLDTFGIWVVQWCS